MAEEKLYRAATIEVHRKRTELEPSKVLAKFVVNYATTFGTEQMDYVTSESKIESAYFNLIPGFPGNKYLVYYEMTDQPLVDSGMTFEELSELIIDDKMKNEEIPIINVMYHAPIDELKIDPKGNFVDLRSAEAVTIKKDEFKLIDLGVSIKLPTGWWGQIVPRSSLFKNHGLIQTNSFGVIDTTYCGEDDHWMLPVYATRDTTIEFNERICQFRIVKDNTFGITKVDSLDGNSRGGFGSTGKV